MSADITHSADEIPGFRHRALECCVSTNLACFDAAKEGEAGGLWITAEQQTGGKGSRGRHWESPVGNLFASLMLKNPCEAKHLPELTFVASLAVGEAVSKYLPNAEIALKWPNDVMVESRKIAGILLESSITKSEIIIVIGIGVNCTSFPSETRHPATSLKANGSVTTATKFFPDLQQSMANALALWDQGRNFGTIRQMWIERAWAMGTSVRIEKHDGTTATGIYEGINSLGHMILSGIDGQRETISVGDIFAIENKKDIGIDR